VLFGVVIDQPTLMKLGGLLVSGFSSVVAVLVAWGLDYKETAGGGSA
jgi:hypothetical protein